MKGRGLAVLVLGLLLAPAAGAAAPGAKTLPAITLRALDGAEVRLDGTGARLLVVDIWATWCGPCAEALPHLDRLARDLGPRGLVVLAVSQDEESERVAPFAKKLGLGALRVLLDPEHRLAEALQPPKMPTTYVVGPGGRILARLPGYHPGDEEKLRERVLEALGAPAAHAPPGRARDTVVTRARKLMGTLFALKAVVPSGRYAQAAAVMDRALDRVAALERLWSPWIESSDLSRVNAGAGGEPVAVASGTFALLERSIEVCEASGRAFDPTFFALSPLYDFRARPFVPPSEEAIAAVLPKVDCRRVRLDPAARTVALQAGMSLHLGGNAKGTALDEAAAVLREAGLRRFVVDGGGDIVASGDGPKGAWRVGIQHPRAARGELIGVVPVRGGAVATSGDYERFAISGGRRYHHIVDPRSGHSAAGCMSATVVLPAGPHAGENADAWATVLCVLGPKEGIPLLRKTVPGAEAAVFEPDGALHVTEGFAGRLGRIQPRAPVAPAPGAKPMEGKAP